MTAHVLTAPLHVPAAHALEVEQLVADVTPPIVHLPPHTPPAVQPAAVVQAAPPIEQVPVPLHVPVAPLQAAELEQLVVELVPAAFSHVPLQTPRFCAQLGEPLVLQLTLVAPAAEHFPAPVQLPDVLHWLPPGVHVVEAL